MRTTKVVFIGAHASRCHWNAACNRETVRIADVIPFQPRRTSPDAALAFYEAAGSTLGSAEMN